LGLLVALVNAGISEKNRKIAVARAAETRIIRPIYCECEYTGRMPPQTAAPAQVKRPMLKPW
jgi:hypothetical protein